MRDRFVEDRLPPPDLMPEFRFDLPELQYPERLNAAGLPARHFKSSLWGRLARFFYFQNITVWISRLIALDPMNELALQMLGFGYNLTKASQKAVATRLRLNALPAAISKVAITPSPTGATLTATASGQERAGPRSASEPPSS